MILEKPKYDVEECQQRDMTYSAPLKVTLRLIVFDVDEDTGRQIGQRHQRTGRFHGRHAPDDTEWHVCCQRDRTGDRVTDASLSWGVFRSRQGQDAQLG